MNIEPPSQHFKQALDKFEFDLEVRRVSVSIAIALCWITSADSWSNAENVPISTKTHVRISLIKHAFQRKLLKYLNALIAHLQSDIYSNCTL